MGVSQKEKDYDATQHEEDHEDEWEEDDNDEGARQYPDHDEHE